MNGSGMSADMQRRHLLLGDITVRLRPGFVADTYFVNGTDAMVRTRWYMQLAANGTYKVVGAPIGEFLPRCGFHWHAHRNQSSRE